MKGSRRTADEKVIEAMLRQRIRFLAEDSRRDERKLRIVGYADAARDIVALLDQSKGDKQ